MSSTPPPLRCEHCGEVIGVYEQFVHVVNGEARETSRAGEPDLVSKGGGSTYHASCFDRLPPTR
jgi:hypothetical protein